MKCAIDNTIDRSVKRGKKLDVISRYLRLKYRVTIEKAALLERLRSIGIKYDLV